MGKLKELFIKESLPELRHLQKQNPSQFKRVQMLIITKQQGNMSKYDLALLLGSSHSSIGNWRKIYIKEGIAGLIKERRGGHKKGALTVHAHQALSARLHDPKGGFRSFIEIQRWLKNEFDIVMEYHAVNKYVKRKFGAKLKVSRKSHVLKSPADEAVFKKLVR